MLFRLRVGIRCFAYPLDELRLLKDHGRVSDASKDRPELARQRLKLTPPSIDNRPKSHEEEEMMERETGETQQKEYKRKIDRTPEDLEVRQLKDKEKQFSQMVRDFFANENSAFDPHNYTRIEKTKKLTRAMRLNSVFDFAKEKSKDQISADYNNYDKFKLNYTYFTARKNEDKMDTGITMNTKRMADYLSGLAPEGDYRNTAEDAVRGLEREKKVPSSSLLSEAAEELHEENKNEVTVGDEELNQEISGRLSPHAKEQIFRLYESGWTVKDLSYKYGLLPNRIKAIVWCRRHFYEEIMPRVEPITWKLGIEREFLYASQFPFLDYGLDLSLMAVLEKGVDNARLTNSPTDLNPPEVVKAKIKAKLENIKPARRKRVDRMMVGKGTHAYKIQDMIVSRGNGRHTVSEMFKRVCMWGQTRPQWLPDQVRLKLHLGPRLASLGYRMGGQAKNYTR